MTNRLLVRTETQQDQLHTPRTERASRTVIFGITGLVVLLLLGLLTVPVLIGMNEFFAATAGCSGLVMMAYRTAGISIARTSEDQWTTEPHVAASQVQTGDLVFFAGADGTPTSPGHVGLVIGHDQMIEAYATGFPIRVASFGTATSPAGDQDPVGFTQPWTNATVSPQASASAASIPTP